MKASLLSWNPTKTQTMWLRSRYLLSRIATPKVQVLGSSTAVVETAHNLGVVKYNCLTTANHVSATCPGGVLSTAPPIIRCPTVDAAKTPKQSSRLLFHHAWTIATPCFMARLTFSFGSNSRSRMLLPDW